MLIRVTIKGSEANIALEGVLSNILKKRGVGPQNGHQD
tara:strand:+ start:834 stop:947 length:114 start_codon:yes stop_codon:yes gene_type:complete